jgi:hypothetical protein
MYQTVVFHWLDDIWGQRRKHSGRGRQQTTFSHVAGRASAEKTTDEKANKFDAVPMAQKIKYSHRMLTDNAWSRDRDLTRLADRDSGSCSSRQMNGN